MNAEERKKILDMVVNGQLTAEEAEKLMAAGEKAEREETGLAGNKFLIIKVHQGENTNVNVRLPIGLAKIAKMFIPKDLEVNGKPLDIDFDEIIKLVETEVTGNIVEVHQIDEETGETTDVEIYLE
jgi:hypothetical protein